MQTQSAQTSPHDGIPRGPMSMTMSEQVHIHPQVLCPYHNKRSNLWCLYLCLWLTITGTDIHKSHRRNHLPHDHQWANIILLCWISLFDGCSQELILFKLETNISYSTCWSSSTV